MKILNVKAQVDKILKEKDRYNFVMSQPVDHPLPKNSLYQSTSFTNLEEVRGRDCDRDTLVTKLVGKQEELGCIQVVSIVGGGGLGKTTLAQLVYNDSPVEKHFDLRIWIYVSNPFDLTAIAKGIISSVENGDSSTNDLNILLGRVRDSISGNKFLLVLDDVGTEEYENWEQLENNLRCGQEGSKILVTTRKTKVANVMGTMDKDIHYPEGLSVEDCWLVLRRIALFGRDEVRFEETGRKIAKKCNGLPLAAKTLGGVLRNKTTIREWNDVLKSNVWEMKEAEVELFPHLLLSYNELSPTQKCCFSYCAVFPKDSDIHVKDLIGYWMALGYLGSDNDNMEERGQKCFDTLAMHSLFQDFVKDDLDGKIIECKMHDIVHDFARFLRNRGKVEAIGINKSTTCQACSPSQVSTMNEFRSLFWDNDESPLNICDCLTRLKVLRLENCYKRIPIMENLIHLRWLSLNGNDLSCGDLKIIFQLFNLQIMSLSSCNLNEIPNEIRNLIHLRHLDLSNNESLEELPKEIGNLIGLRHLDLSYNESLEKLPDEIGNLIYLKHLNLRGNMFLEELPRKIGNLIQLSHLDLCLNMSLKELPESMCGLQELQTLDINACDSLCRLPEGLAKLTGLHTLTGFKGGSGGSRLRLLKNLNHLGGVISLKIRLGGDEDLEEVVEDAREAELRNKIHMEGLVLCFEDEMDEKEESSRVRMDVIDALQPHPNLKEMEIHYYQGSKLPMGWLVSPLNQLRKVGLFNCSHLSSLPSLGKLACLEEIKMYGMEVLQYVGREFLGIEEGAILNNQSSSNTNVIAFTKLKKLIFENCEKWKEWEDITAEEEESAALSVMPCLTTLEILSCIGLTSLPHRLLRKASSLEEFIIYNTTELRRYVDVDCSYWKSISRNNPRLNLMIC